MFTFGQRDSDLSFSGTIIYRKILKDYLPPPHTPPYHVRFGKFREILQVFMFTSCRVWRPRRVTQPMLDWPWSARIYLVGPVQFGELDDLLDDHSMRSAQ